MRILCLLNIHRLHLAHGRSHDTSLFAVFFSEDHWLVPAPVLRFLGQLKLDIVLVESANDVVHHLRTLTRSHTACPLVLRIFVCNVILLPQDLFLSRAAALILATTMTRCVHKLDFHVDILRMLIVVGSSAVRDNTFELVRVDERG